MQNSKKSRREFFFAASEASFKFALANTAIYAVGSAFKNLDGNLVAGAKSWVDAGTYSCGGCTTQNVNLTMPCNLGETRYEERPGDPFGDACGVNTPSCAALTCSP